MPARQFGCLTGAHVNSGKEFAGSLPVGCFILVLAAIAAFPASGAEPVDFSAFHMRLAACSTQTDYYPEDTADLGPHELGRNEREWSACAYKGVEELVLPYTEFPEDYKAIMASHRQLTDQVESGTITREERRQRMQAMLAAIRTKEVEAADAARRQAEALTDANRRRAEMERIQEQQRAAMRIHRSIGRRF
jgi:polyhydroxyalkanoate synthesis regulator phasin